MLQIGVLTSGGDSPGMNPALRAVVRRALAFGAEVVGVHEGFRGLVAGGERLFACGWVDVSRILHQGGTHFGTARCPEFRQLEGRRAAVRNLLSWGVSRLAVIGGDGSLTGAAVLREEWADHASALVEAGEVAPEVAAEHPSLRVVGMVGSIDNDLWGTDRTIGCDSALHRIVDAVDALTSTARSHQRSFVVEVMGRHCGFLALAGAVCTGADYVLLPESPPEDWRSEVLASVRAAREQGKRKSIVIVSEGARDRSGAPITSAEVRACLEEELQIETRVTVLGHVQRGGSPSAYDRVMSTILGARGAEALLRMGPDDPPVVMSTDGDRVFPRPLDEALARTQALSKAVAEGRYTQAVADRGPEFEALWRLQPELTQTPPDVGSAPRKRLLMVHAGAPAPGMNAATRAFVRLAEYRGHAPWLAQEGFRGLLAGDVAPASWVDVSGIVSQGSTVIGTRRGGHEDPAEVAAALAAHQLEGVVLVGGFETLQAAAALGRQGIPVAVVPATISNNVPGSDPSVGTDTALNVITQAVQQLKESAIGSRDRVFVVEVMGRRCGYLAVVAGLGSGAELVYTHESGVSLDRLRNDVASLVEAYDRGRSVAIVLVADGASSTYSANDLARIFAAEAGGRFDTRVCVLGHLQQGGRPAPADRLLATRLTDVAVDWVAAPPEGGGAVLVGAEAGSIVLTPCDELLASADLAHRRPAVPPHHNWMDVAAVFGEGVS